jgi:hypothetical protein
LGSEKKRLWNSQRKTEKRRGKGKRGTAVFDGNDKIQIAGCKSSAPGNNRKKQMGEYTLWIDIRCVGGY